MIKKIIFDLDDTLLCQRKEYLNDYQEILKKYNLSSDVDSASNLYKTIGKYELDILKYSKESLLEYLRENYNSEVNMELINDIINYTSTWCNPVSENISDILFYLKDKYELNVLTNWFVDAQKRRLESVNIAHYFKEIIGPEDFIKPNEESFKYFCGNCSPDECVVIGDRINIDIEVPNKLGMKTILCDYNNRYEDYQGVKINSLDELMNIL